MSGLTPFRVFIALSICESMLFRFFLISLHVRNTTLFFLQMQELSEVKQPWGSYLIPTLTVAFLKKLKTR